jgi:hypothetical protein
MVAERITDKRDISQLRAAYNVAFAQLAREVGIWQELRARNPHPSAVEEARHRVRQAEAAYRECRNAISSVLIEHELRTSPAQIRRCSLPSSSSLQGSEYYDRRNLRAYRT